MPARVNDPQAGDRPLGPRSQPRPVAPAPGRFGVLFGGAGLLLPAGLACEFVDEAEVHPVPGAPSRLRGLMQRQGRPLPVFGSSPARSFGRQRLRVLVIDEGRNAAALEIDFPPEPVDPVDACDAATPCPPACPPGALERAWRCAGHEEMFWEFDPGRLFELLGGFR